MKSPEGFTPPQTKIEEVEEEIAPKSPEVEVASIDSESLEQYGETIETYVEQQSVNVTAQAKQKIESSAMSMNVLPELLNSAKTEHDIDNKLIQIQSEADQLTEEAKVEISKTITETSIEKTVEVENSLSWKQVFETSAGKEFSESMRGVVNGKQEVTRGRITNDFSVREFVRKNPQEAKQFNDIFQKEFGKPHPDLAQAYREIAGLQQKPPEIQPEDPKYAELSYRIDNDPEYQKLRGELDIQHKMRVFGTTDFKSMSLERFSELCNTDANLKFSSDREAEKEFRKRFAEKSTLYDEREKTRVYRDPDGIINRDRDPLFLKMFEPDSRGVGLMRDEALRQFTIRYPEKSRGYAEKYIDIQAFVKNVEQSPKPVKTENAEKPKEVTAHKLSDVFEKAGVESRVVKIENGGEFSEIIILEKKEVPTEKMARLYRGINHLDASVFEQIPYAMRTENGSGKPTTLESVRQEVDTLAKNPTYENLLAYTDKVRSNLSPEEVRRMDDDLARIENGILDGNSTRKELIYKQIEHGGGWGDSGITPYISASFSPYEAVGYGNEGLVVIDVPLSEIEDFRADGTEVNIKGALDKKYITAILPRKREGTKEKEQLDQEIYRALEKVYESADVPLFDNQEMLSQREQKLLQEAELDREQWKKDVELVRQKRVAKLTKKFPEIKIDSGNSPLNLLDQGVDTYTKVKQNIFDQYKTRLEKIGRNGRNIDDYEFSETEYSERKKFDRAKTSDIMLIKLRELTLRLEEKEEERNNRR